MNLAYQCDAQGVFVGETRVQEDPMEPGAWLLPPDCIVDAPPTFDEETQIAVYLDGAWSVHDLPESQDETSATTPLDDVPAPSVSTVVATQDNRPEVGAHEIAVIVDGQWTVVADWRGTPYWLADDTEYRITELGQTPPEGARLSSPPILSTPPMNLVDAKTAQVSALRSAYASLVHQPMGLTTAAGHEGFFACDADSVATLTAVLAACEPSQTFSPNVWLDAGGVPVTPFNFADLQALAAAIVHRPAPDYQTLLEKIGQVVSATTIAEVQAVAW